MTHEDMLDFVPDPEQAKQTAGKLRITLVPPSLLLWVARVREYGMKKYKDEYNWKKVPKRSYLDAILRHLFSYILGERYDRESGIPHMAHIACNIAFILELENPINPEDGL